MFYKFHRIGENEKLRGIVEDEAKIKDLLQNTKRNDEKNIK